jgi:transcriptional pleiotropic regulator of transition state genes
MGSVVIPAELRRVMGFRENNPIEIYIKNNNIILQKIEPECIFCGSKEALGSFRGKNVCKRCTKKIYDTALTNGEK